MLSRRRGRRYWSRNQIVYFPVESETPPTPTLYPYLYTSTSRLISSLPLASSSTISVPSGYALYYFSQNNSLSAAGHLVNYTNQTISYTISPHPEFTTHYLLQENDGQPLQVYSTPTTPFFSLEDLQSSDSNSTSVVFQSSFVKFF